MVRTGKRRIKASIDASEAIPFVQLVEPRPIASLKPYVRNPRTHTNKQIGQIAASIRAFGFNNPVLIDRNDEIIAGHGRVEAAKLLELESVATIRLEHLSEAEKRAYILADNKLAEKAGWDREILTIELQNLIEIETEFSITATGFEIAEIDGLMKIIDEDEAAETEEPPADLDPEAPVTSTLGDLWRLGQHRLLCGDARDPLAYARLLKGGKARLIITDPPYNVPILGHVSGLGQVKHDDFVMASGEMTGPEFTTFLATVFTNLAAYSLDGSIHFISTDWRHLYEFLHAGRLAYTELKNLVVWAKTNAGAMPLSTMRPGTPSMHPPLAWPRTQDMADDKDNSDYEIGYGKPPKHTRFKPGQSGNRHGRPSGARNLRTDLVDELAKRIAISEGGRRHAVSKQRGMLKQLIAKAIEGDVRAANTVLSLVERLLDARADADMSAAVTAQDGAIVADFLRRHGVAEQPLTKTDGSTRSEVDAESSDTPLDERACQNNRSDS